MSYFNGVEVDYAAYQGYYDVNSPTYNTQYASQYRTVVGPLRNDDKSAFLITLETAVDPDSEDIVPFITGTRTLLLEQSVKDYAPTLPLDLYLLGGFCGTYDIQVMKIDIMV